MPMIKRRRRMDKNKRRCLYGVEKKPNSIQSIETPITPVEEEPIVKKHKNGRIINLKVEEKINEDHSTDEKSESKCKVADKSTKKDKMIEKSKEESIEDVKVEISNPKSSAKTKQRYKNFNFIYVFYVLTLFDAYYNNK